MEILTVAPKVLDYALNVLYVFQQFFITQSACQVRFPFFLRDKCRHLNWFRYTRGCHFTSEFQHHRCREHAFLAIRWCISPEGSSYEP